jgi:hypothetical protein
MCQKLHNNQVFSHGAVFFTVGLIKAYFSGKWEIIFRPVQSQSLNSLPVKAAQFFYGIALTFASRKNYKKILV